MARYFFHVCCGFALERDEAGLECTSLEAAERQARAILGTRIAYDRELSVDCPSIEIHDCGGKVSTVTLSLSVSRNGLV